MSGFKRPCRSDNPAISYRGKRVEGASFDLSDSVRKEHSPPVSDGKEQSNIKSEPKSPQILSTTELVSAVGHIWNLVNPLSIFKHKGKIYHDDSGCQKNVILLDPGKIEVDRTPTLDDDSKYFYIDTSKTRYITAMVLAKFEFIKITQKMSVFEPCSENYTCLLFCQFLKESTNLSIESWEAKRLTRLRTSYKLNNIYGWMKDIIPVGSQNPVNVTEFEDKKTGKYIFSRSTIIDEEGCISADAAYPRNNLALSSSECYSDSVKSKDASLCDDTDLSTNTGITSSLSSDYCYRDLQDINTNNCVLKETCSSVCADYHIDLLAQCQLEKFPHNPSYEEVQENTRKLPQKFVMEDKHGMEAHLSARGRPHYALAKHEHAFAGAFAGIFVSICLHPADTIKTIIQSCSSEQKSMCDIGRSIVSERGVTGLYRGIASNIASSAPISAIYTFTYESVKGSLLEAFPEEYMFFAHCIAGGCASIATSVIFTPSERIKQQMQIGSHYHNCWNAFVGIIGKGGLASLYTGWGAVLCRNVPHSIIKFYTYERLKQLMVSSQNSSAQPNTLQLLVCGGVAGSTAALFTTPFDVVKTRLQTQTPGSMSQYKSVLHALQEIWKKEGLRGLYRGLVPRLAMYMSQGALFFASYESFKRLFSLDLPQLNAQRINYKENTEDDSTSLQLPS